MNAFYKVSPGPTFDILKNHVEAHKKANTAAIEWAKSHKLPVTHISGTRVWFERVFQPPPSAWKKDKKDGFTPRLKTKAGLKLAEELKDLPQYPSMMNLILTFIGRREKDLLHINESGWPGMAKNKSEAFYRLHIDPYWLPDDMTGLEEITASEYHKEPTKA